MAYTKQTWQDLPNTTTPITATRMNHIEDGVYDANKLRGGLIAVGSLWTDGQGESLTSSTWYGFGDITSTRQNNIKNFVSGILEYDSTAKTFKVHTKGMVSYIKTFMTISGNTGPNIKGIWFSCKNKDTLPTGVSTLDNNMTTGGIIALIGGGTYSGCSNEMGYVVEATGDVTFTINPTFQPYGGNIVPGSSGTRCFLKVEVYAKYE